MDPEETQKNTTSVSPTPPEALEGEEKALTASVEIDKEMRETAISGDLKDDVQSILTAEGITQNIAPVQKPVPPKLEQKKVVSVADTLFIQKDAQYPNTVTPPKTKDTVPASSATKPLEEKIPVESNAIPKKEMPPETTGIESAVLLKNTDPEAVRNTSIRTLHSDISDSVKTQKTSLASIAVAETDRRSTQQQPPQEPRDTKKILRTIFIILGILLILGGIGALGTIVALRLSGGRNVPIENNNTLIFVNEELSVGLPETRFGTLDTLIDVRESADTLSLGHILKLNLTPAGTTTPLAINDFIARLGTSAPSSLLRTFTGEYVLGIHSLATNEFLLIVAVENRDAGFANMLKWERDLADDMSFLIRESTQATRTGTSTVDVFANKTLFKDIVVENRDVRALLDDNGDIRLGYSFPQPNTLIIANNENSFIELFTRLSGVRFSE